MKKSTVSSLVRFNLLVILIITSFSLSSQTISNKNNPDWSNPADWISGEPNYNTTQTATLNHQSVISEFLTVNHTVIINENIALATDTGITIENGGTLQIDGDLLMLGGILTIENGGALIVSGHLQNFSTANIIVNAGATVIINSTGGITWGGNWSSINNTATITINGSLIIAENMIVNAFINGTGNINVDGIFDLQGGSVFGCSTLGAACCGSGAVAFGTGCFMPDGSAEVFTSVQTGDWDDASTWDKSGAPNNQDDIIISSGHVVTLNKGSGPIVNNLTIQTGGEFYQDNKEIEIKGNYINNGIHNIDKKELNFTGENTLFSGTGTINLNGTNSNMYTLSFKENMISQAGTHMLIFQLGSSKGVEIEKTFTNNGIIEMAGNVSGNGEWINNANSELFIFQEIFGVPITADLGFNIVHYSDVANQNVVVPVNSTYWNLVIGGGGVKTLTSNIIIKNFIVINGTLDTDDGFDYQLTVGGNWQNKGQFIQNEGKVIFNSIADIEIFSQNGPQIFYDLEIAIDSANANLLSTLKVENELTFTKGNIAAPLPYKVTLGTSINSPGSLIHNDESFVTGEFERWINDASTGVFFPIGSSRSPNFVEITSTNITPGLLKMAFTNDSPGNNGAIWIEGIDTFYNTFNDGHYRMNSYNGFSSVNYDLEIDLRSYSSFPIDGTETLVKRATSATPWTLQGNVGTNDMMTVTRLGLSGIEEIAIIDTLNCVTPPPPNFTTAPASACINETGVVYTVNVQIGATYIWEVIGGSIISGQGSNSIVVDFDSTGIVGEVNVLAVDPLCGASNISKQAVSIFPLKISAIQGPSVTADSTKNVPYSVINNAGHTYNWSVNNGVQIAGGTSNSILIDWGAIGSAQVAVAATYTGCPSAAASIKDITLFDTYTTAQSGDYALGATWIGGISPPDSANVKIFDNHVVTLSSDVTVNNIVLGPASQLENNGNKIEIYNYYQSQGIHNATTALTGANITFSSSSNDAVLSGLGTITANEIIINNGVWNLDASSILNIDATTFSISASKLDVFGNIIIKNNIQTISGGTFIASNKNSSVHYSSSTNAQNILIPDAYYNLKLSGTSQKTLLGDVSIKGDFTDVDNTLNTSGNKVAFSGNGAQIISGSSTFDVLEVDNFSGITPAIYVNDSITINGQLSLLNGNIDAGSAGLIDITNTGNISGGSTSRFIDGAVRWDFPSNIADYLIPLADNGRYAPIELNLAAPGSFTMEYYALAYPDTTTDSTITAISRVEFWKIDNNDAVTADMVRLYLYDPTWSGITNPFDLRIANYMGLVPSGSWTESDSVPSFGFSGGGDYIQSANITDFQYLTFGSKQGDNALPIELVSFDATYLAQHIVKLEWQTASEINNDYFTIERIKDGPTWEEVIRIDGAGNSNNPLNYTAYDESPYLGTTFYRLKQTDYDGQFSYSEIESVTIDEIDDLPIYVFPNPTIGKITILGSKLEFEDIHFFNYLGQDITQMVIIGEITSVGITYDLSHLNTGFYTIKTATTTRKVFKN